MARLGNKQLRRRANKANHRRRRTTRGYRQQSKFQKYKAYSQIGDSKVEPTTQ